MRAWDGRAAAPGHRRPAHPVIVTPLGEDAQVDYADGGYGVIRSGRVPMSARLRADAWVSRKDVCLLTLRSSAAIRAQLHETALDGVASSARLDNLKEGTQHAVVHDPTFRDVHRSNRLTGQTRAASRCHAHTHRRQFSFDPDVWNRIRTRDQTSSEPTKTRDPQLGETLMADAADSAVFWPLRRSLEAAAVLAMLLLPPSPVWARPGDLDPSFGSGGVVTTGFGSASSDLAFAIVLQPDGRIVAAGASSSDTGPSGFALARYNADGTLDATFGSSGIVVTDMGASDETAHAVGLQPDGKIVAAGYWLRGNGTPSRFALARYDGNGALDSTFGSGGTVTTDLGGGGALAYAVAIQPDGKILAAGVNLGGGVALVRYNSDGSLDQSFGGGGMVSGGAREAAAMLLQPDGKIVLAGRSYDDNFALLRYAADGTFDPTFGTGGMVTTPVGPDFDRALSVALQPDGRIIAAGQACASSSAGCGFALARYLPNGALDSGFGNAGTVRTDVGLGSLFDAATGVGVEPGGTIVAVGSSLTACGVGGCNRFALARYDSNGALEPTFGAGGVVTTDLPGGGAVGYALAIQAQGRIVVAGIRSSPTQDFAFAGYLSSECGNGRIEAGEQCDDGGIAGGDGCDVSCQHEPMPTSTVTSTPPPMPTATVTTAPSITPTSTTMTSTPTATDTATVTPAPTATASATITATPTTIAAVTPTPTATPTPAVCGNGSEEPDEECDDGNAVPNDGCSATCTLEPCVAAPIPGCLEVAQAQLWSNEKAVGKERLKLLWKRVASATTQGAFGDPVEGTTRVALCLYGDGGALIRGFVVDQGGQPCGVTPCWSAQGTKGYRYKDKTAAADGISKIGYGAGGPGKGKADAAGANNASKGKTALPSGVVAALSGNTHPTMQFVTSNGLCLGATMTDVTRDDGFQYKARKK